MYDEKMFVDTGANADPEAGPGADMPADAAQEVMANG